MAVRRGSPCSFASCAYSHKLGGSSTDCYSSSEGALLRVVAKWPRSPSVAGRGLLDKAERVLIKSA